VKALTVKLPEPLFAAIANDAKRRQISKSEIARERLERAGGARDSFWSQMEDLAIDGDSLPNDLSSTKRHLKLPAGSPRQLP